MAHVAEIFLAPMEDSDTRTFMGGAGVGGWVGGWGGGWGGGGGGGGWVGGGGGVLTMFGVMGRLGPLTHLFQPM